MALYVAEFVVADIEEIQWSSRLFDYLTVSDEQKEIIMALAEVQTRPKPGSGFNDFVDGKGRGLNLLLQNVTWLLLSCWILTYNKAAPPGVGKTLTAEAVSENLMQPLYSVREPLVFLGKVSCNTSRSLPEN